MLCDEHFSLEAHPVRSMEGVSELRVASRLASDVDCARLEQERAGARRRFWCRRSSRPTCSTSSSRASLSTKTARTPATTATATTTASATTIARATATRCATTARRTKAIRSENLPRRRALEAPAPASSEARRVCMRAQSRGIVILGKRHVVVIKDCVLRRNSFLVSERRGLGLFLITLPARYYVHTASLLLLALHPQVFNIFGTAPRRRTGRCASF
jgi:hypothetical protein